MESPAKESVGFKHHGAAFFPLLLLVVLLLVGGGGGGGGGGDGRGEHGEVGAARETVECGGADWDSREARSRSRGDGHVWFGAEDVARHVHLVERRLLVRVYNAEMAVCEAFAVDVEEPRVSVVAFGWPGGYGRRHDGCSLRVWGRDISGWCCCCC